MNVIELARNKRDNTVDMLTGCWNRLHVSDDNVEMVRLITAAEDYAGQLAKYQTEYVGVLRDNGICKLSNKPCGDDTDFEKLVDAVKSSDDSDAVQELCSKLKSVMYDVFLSHSKKIREREPWYDQYK